MRDKYRYVYDNWYVKSCQQSNEKPVSFEIYCKRVPAVIVDELEMYLDSGMTP